MSIKVNIHKTHRQFTNGLDIVEVEGNTVGNCLDKLVRQFPNMEKALFDKKGTLLRVIEIYINSKSAYPNERAKQVKDGDNIHITLLLAGG
ncbi:MAG: MoaD/ThiS family protein [Deltaproteobacteria bacterium]|nr:MoaD/ThiS family protein [Deltaproteobacteria bacterium]MBW2117606.1 MoaD/ThiS family protein [Deltaproteobacteria bacterium]MBW2344182.1 MoaD/ThiS family protein [Deltaproteobacteria bacterium]